MALRINHNIAAMDAWRNLTNTTRQMAVTMEKLSSGYRVNRAADDPAGLVISEQFRAQIAGLNRAIQNSEGSINMIQTAEGALNEINNLLINMRELAIHAANEGFNDTNQLAADQAEITNAITTITRIASTTQFGTKKLLDGSAENTATITTSNTSLVTLSSSQLEDGVHSITAVKATESSATIDTQVFGLSTPTSPYNLSDGIHNIDVIQASSGAVKQGSRSLTALDAWGNTMAFNETTTGYASIDAGALTWTNAATPVTVVFQINYQESGSNPVGMQTLTIRTDTVATGVLAANIVSKLNTAINTNSYLAGKVQATFTENAGSDDTMRIIATNAGTQYSLAIGSITATQATVQTELSVMANSNDRGISGSRISLTAQYSTTDASAVSSWTALFSIGSQAFNTLSDLVTAINGSLGLDPAATDGGFGTFSANAGAANKVMATIVSAGGSNFLKFYTLDEGSQYTLKLNAAGGTGTSAYEVLGIGVDSIAQTGLDAIVRFDGYTNNIDDVRYHYDITSSTFDPTVNLYTTDNAETRGSLSMTRAMAYSGGIDIGNMLLTVKARTYSARLDGASAITVTAGKETTLFNSARDQSIKVKYSLKSDGGTESLYVTDQSLVFQIGANVGQTVKIGIPNLSADKLGRGLDNVTIASLADIDVMTAAGAQEAQWVIDKAINDVTNIRGTIGSFQKNTLESNLTNLRIAAQNLSASESSIRDTDMAKEMSTFTKHQILLQAGVAMLAQGNQIPQVVLSLFG